jgi:glycosyltransferase involved in cell wall biosynthesis
MSRCPTLEELPFPPSGKTGWPWTIASSQLPQTMHDGTAWPRIGIITPSYNQADFLEETIRSVLLQGYPDMEYVVIDGGSNDESREIILKYQQWLSFWVSEPDRGQSCAINKGLRRLTGDIFNWINSDDLLLPKSLQTIAESYRLHPDSLLAGDVLYRYDVSRREERVQQRHVEFNRMVEFWNDTASFHQPGIFIPLQLMNKVGTLDEGLHYAFDYDLFCRLLSVARVTYVSEPVAAYRIHPASKSISQSHCFLSELCAASRRYWSMIPNLGLPASDPKGAGLLFRVGCWQILHNDSNGTALIKEALGMDPLRAVSSTLQYFPQWLWRRWSRKTPKC